MFVWCPFDALFAILCLHLLTLWTWMKSEPNYAQLSNWPWWSLVRSKTSQIQKNLIIFRHHFWRLKTKTVHIFLHGLSLSMTTFYNISMSCLALKSLMFRSNLGLINTVSSVRSKPSFEVLKLASLRSSGGSLWKGESSQKRFLLFSFSDSQRCKLPGAVSWVYCLKEALARWCTVHGQGQNKPQLCLVHWPSIQITRHSAGQVQFCSAVFFVTLLYLLHLSTSVCVSENPSQPCHESQAFSMWNLPRFSTASDRFNSPSHGGRAYRSTEEASHAQRHLVRFGGENYTICHSLEPSLMDQKSAKPFFRSLSNFPMCCLSDGMQIPPMAVPVFYFPRLLTGLSCKIEHTIRRGYVGHNAETIKVRTVGTDRSVCPV